VRLESGELDMLLFDFLGAIIYYKDAENLLLRPRRVEIVEHQSPTARGSRFVLDSTLSREIIDPARHPLRVDVKLLTLHDFSIEKVTPAGKPL
jgi:SHS2 domain-containing protein